MHRLKLIGIALLALLLSLIAPTVALAQSLTSGQLQTVCTAVKADPTANAARIAGDTVALRAWLDGARSPTQLVWRAAVTPQEADEAANWVTFDGLTAGKRDSWLQFLRYDRDYGRNRVRSWVTDVWGSATAGSAAEAILQAGTAPGTNLQVVLGGNSKTTGTVTALDASWDAAAPQSAIDWLVQPGNCV